MKTKICSKLPKKLEGVKKLVLVTLSLIQTVKMFPTGDHCSFLQGSDSSSITLTGVDGDSNSRDRDNPCQSNQFRVAILLKADAMPATNKKAQIFSYYNKVKIYFKNQNGRYQLRVWKQGEAGDGVVHKYHVAGADRWYFLWYELSSTKSEIAIRHTYPWDQDENQKETKNLGKKLIKTIVYS